MGLRPSCFLDPLRCFLFFRHNFPGREREAEERPPCESMGNAQWAIGDDCFLRAGARRCRWLETNALRKSLFSATESRRSNFFCLSGASE